ncbi:Translational activator GCN1 [Hordeum vulgare]|nr:Translational activator GCN1 [Hordeum vulgare]
MHLASKKAMLIRTFCYLTARSTLGLNAKWYAVFVGKVPGVYSSWEDCSEQVAFVSNNNHTRFKTRRATEEAYANYVQKHTVGVIEVGNIVVGKAAPRLAVKNFIIIVEFITIDLLWRWCARFVHVQGNLTI